MRTCKKCGNRLPDNTMTCSACGEPFSLSGGSEKTLSRFLYIIVLTVSSVYAFFFLASGLCELFSRFSESYYLTDLLPLPFVYLFLPLALAVFIIIIITTEQSKLLIIFPIAGIAAEIVYFILKHREYIDMAFEEYMLAILVMELFSSVLVIVFFIVMIRFILKGCSISQIRILIAAAFVLVFARAVLKYSLSDETDPDELIGYTSNIKFYIMAAAALLNVKRRYVNSIRYGNYIKRSDQ